MLAFVTTSAWLDAAYGAPLGRHLLDAGLVELVERPAERTFAGADVNSLIVVLRRGAAGDVLLRQVGRPDRRVGRAALAAAPKWGGPLLRAPAAAPLLARGVPLGDVCRVGSYLITGCDAFFYRAGPGGVDAACLRPVVKSTRGEHAILLDGAPRRWLVSAADPAAARRGEATRAVADGMPELSGVRVAPRLVGDRAGAGARAGRADGARPAPRVPQPARLGVGRVVPAVAARRRGAGGTGGVPAERGGRAAAGGARAARTAAVAGR